MRLKRAVIATAIVMLWVGILHRMRGKPTADLPRPFLQPSISQRYQLVDPQPPVGPIEIRSLRIYDIRDITTPIAQDMRTWPPSARGASKVSAANTQNRSLSEQATILVERMIRDGITPLEWNDSTRGGSVIIAGDGWIAVWQSARGHTEIERLLSDIRQAKSMQ